MLSILDWIRTRPDQEQIIFFMAKWIADKRKTDRYFRMGGLDPDEWFYRKYGLTMTEYRGKVKKQWEATADETKSA